MKYYALRKETEKGSNRIGDKITEVDMEKKTREKDR